MTRLRLRGAWSMVADGIVAGRLEHRLETCDVCHARTACIRVEGYDLPPEVPWTRTIIVLLKAVPVGDPRTPPYVAVFLGVGCGCYAKFHRQIVHIQEKILRQFER